MPDSPFADQPQQWSRAAEHYEREFVDPDQPGFRIAARFETQHRRDEQRYSSVFRLPSDKQGTNVMNATASLFSHPRVPLLDLLNLRGRGTANPGASPESTGNEGSGLTPMRRQQRLGSRRVALLGEVGVLAVAHGNEGF